MVAMQKNMQSGLDAVLRCCAGQAIVEFVVGLVAVLVLVSAILQIGVLGREHTGAMADARALAGQYAMSPVYTEPTPGPYYIQDWREAADNVAYSRDDQPTAITADGVSSGLVAHARPADLAAWVPGNAVSAMQEPSAVLPGFWLVHGVSPTRTVRIDSTNSIPAFRHLLYASDSIQLHGDVWMTWTKGIY